MADADAGAKRAGIVATGLSLEGAVSSASGNPFAETGFAVAPRVTDVWLWTRSAGDRTHGAVVGARLTFDEPVTVEGGPPTVEVRVGGKVGGAVPHVSGAGGTHLELSRAVTEGGGGRQPPGGRGGGGQPFAQRRERGVDGVGAGGGARPSRGRSSAGAGRGGEAAGDGAWSRHRPVGGDRQGAGQPENTSRDKCPDATYRPGPVPHDQLTEPKPPSRTASHPAPLAANTTP